MIITLWDAVGLAATAHESEDARELMVVATNSEATSREFEVLGSLPGVTGIGEIVLRDPQHRWRDARVEGGGRHVMGEEPRETRIDEEDWHRKLDCVA